jgi:2-methylcitrate dehydratase PrpD
MVGRPYAPGKNADVDAQFSLSYCLATVLLTGNMRLADLKPEATLSVDRRAWADRIPIHLEDALKGKWTARVEVKLRDGRLLTRTREKAGGQSDAPLSTEELIAKFVDANAAGETGMSDGKAGRLAGLLLDLPRLPSVAAIGAALVPATTKNADVRQTG